MMMKALIKADTAVTELCARYDSLGDHEWSLFLPTREGSDSFQDALARLAKDVGKIRCDGDPAGEIAKGYLLEVLDVLDARTADDRAYPSRSVSKLLRKISSLTGLHPAEPEERLVALEGVLGQSQALLDACEDLGRTASPGSRKLLLDSLTSLTEAAAKSHDLLKDAFPGAEPVDLERVHNSFSEASQRADSARAALESAPAGGDQGSSALGYAEGLRRFYGIGLDELLAWHRDEVEYCNEQLHRVAKEMDPHRDPFTILDEDAGACSSPESMYALLEQYVARARAECLKYTSLPTGEECRVLRVPEHLKGYYPWGGYNYAGNILKGNVLGAVFLNQYNYQHISRGWIQINAVHECYPGHHAQAVKTAAADMPGSFKIATLMATAAPLAEGIAHRTEMLMRNIFADDPAYLLFVWYRRLHTAVRIWVDLLHFHFGNSPDEAAELYVKYLRFEPKVARGQMYSQLVTPGYFTVYYYGMKALEEIQKESGWQDPEFTDLIFSCGKVSLRVLKQIMELDPADRARLLSSFRGVDTRQAYS